jgi:alpha/beta superfamily hydrolase
MTSSSTRHATPLREIAGPAGRLEARLDEPAGAIRAVAVLAPPHPQLGGTLQDRVVHQAMAGLVAVGCAVLRFNYRGAGTSEGSFGGGTGEQEDFRAAVEAAATRYPGLPIWAAGYSFGAWVAHEAGGPDPRVSAVIAIAPPVPGYDFAASRPEGQPIFVVHGERDELSPLKAVQKFYGTLPEPRELVVIDGANHVFDGHASEIADALADLLEEHWTTED